jgi:hypothetical protein
VKRFGNFMAVKARLKAAVGHHDFAYWKYFDTRYTRSVSACVMNLAIFFVLSASVRISSLQNRLLKCLLIRSPSFWLLQHIITHLTIILHRCCLAVDTLDYWKYTIPDTQEVFLCLCNEPGKFLCTKSICLYIFSAKSAFKIFGH